MKLLVLAFLTIPLSVLAQKREIDLAALQRSGKISAVNRNISIANDQKTGIHLDEGGREGIAWLNGVTFSSGTLELDIRGKDVLQKSFVGIAFHGVNDSTYDAIYFRPFNFHSKDSVRKIHAVQYISHPKYTWKKLRDERNGQYEKALINPPDPNGWFHARIEVSGNQISVFVNDDKSPSLVVNKLNNQTTGKLGLWTGDGADGDFANLRITSRK